MKILVLNGPNINMLGIREVELYGGKSYSDLVNHCHNIAAADGVELEVRQTNHEGVLVDWIQESRGVFDAIILNAAAYTHTSVAILDSLKAVNSRVVEVHLTEPKNREDFRSFSFVSLASEKTFSGLGFGSYTAAIHYLSGKVG